MRIFLLLLLVVPVLELWLLIAVGSVIGPWPTVALVLLTAVAGIGLLRREGLKTLLQGSRKLEGGELPAAEMLEGLILAVSGALLLAPGFMTDIAGFLGLVPVTRRWLVRQLLASSNFNGFVMNERGRHQGNSGRVIEAEYWRDENKRG